MNYTANPMPGSTRHLTGEHSTFSMWARYRLGPPYDNFVDCYLNMSSGEWWSAVYPK